MALVAAGLAAQTPPPQPTPDAQQGQGEQVHTGTTSGLDSEARLEALLGDHQFLHIESELPRMPPEQAQFYRGILANRDNDPKASILLLEPLVDKVAAGGNTAQERILRKALAEDYLRTADMAKAARAYEALETRLQSHLSPEDQDEIELPLKLAPLAAANPPMTVEPYEPFLLQITRNPLGLTELPVYVDARPHSWMIDPTAPFNLISRSEAKEAGLKVSDEFAVIHTLTGRPMQVHMTVIPRFTIGGRITLRNMTAFVFEDADYAFPRSHYQVEGELGYAALSALGSLTITSDAIIEVRPFKPPLATDKEDPPMPGARFFLDGDQMIVALGAKGQERMYAIDASGQQTYLTSRYYDEHTENFAGQKMELFSIPGAQNKPPQPAFVAETVPLTVGLTTVEAHYIQVITEPIGLAALDDVYGVLGMDFLDQLKAYTFDYRTMRFGVRTE
ncbi:MAG: retropepsin-like aspartic protease [Terracidiphilus sp.]|jgi:predicted aspartyl protease